QICKWEQKCRARAQENVSLSAHRARKSFEPSFFGELRMKNTYLSSQAIRKPLMKLRGQSNFGNEQERLPPLHQHSIDKRKIDFSFSTAHFAHQKMGLKFQIFRKCIGNRLLFR